VAFAEGALGLRVWSRQAELLRACAEYPRVACRSGHKVSKSTSAAALAIWWAIQGGRALIVAPGEAQIKSIIWHELQRFERAAPVPLGGALAIDPRTGWSFPGGGQIIGIATDKPIRLAGYSGARLLYIVDEAPGVSDEMFEPIMGNLAGGARLVLLGNPVFLTGLFRRCFVSERDMWHLMHISSEDSPNVTGECCIPGLATPEWIAEMEARWGRQSNWFRVRVLGEFPDADDDSLLPLAWIEAAQERWKVLKATGTMPEPDLLSLDVAGGTGRDAGVIAACAGLTVVDLWQSNTADTMEQTGRMYQGSRRGCRLVVDADGVGAGVVHRLRELGVRDLTAYQGGESAPGTDESGELSFANLRAWSWWHVRDLLDPAHGYEPALPPDDQLVEDLLSARYKNTSTGAVQLEPKETIRKRLGRSPDRGDAVVMAWSQYAGNAYAPLPVGDITTH
jgi:hypothetical protein